MSLKFIALSGTTAVNENLYLYESKNEILVVDCGIGFPDSEMLGIDLLIPDFSYLRKNAAKIKGIVITHGHEDHFGALPFLIKDINLPIFAPPLAAAFIKEAFEETGIRNYQINILDPNKGQVKLGPFQITPFQAPHSVPDTLGLIINTPEGQIVHLAEHKFEENAVDGSFFDVAKIKAAGQKGFLALASDCLGANRPGFVASEQEIESRIEKIARRAKKAIFFTTISSNISRLQQAINVATKLGRKVVFIGRSIDSKVKIAHSLSRLRFLADQEISLHESRKYSAQKLFYIVAGSYGQVGSALYKIALGEHKFLTVRKEDLVIFSSDPAPPGSRETIDFVVDRLYEREAEVHYYELNEGLHVSGHGNQEDIKKVFSLVRPKYFLPIGGAIRYMRAYTQLVKEAGFNPKTVFELKNGETVEFKNGQARRGETLEVKEILVDGLGVSEDGGLVVRERQVLSRHGFVIVLIQVDKKKRRLITQPDLISRGFVFQKDRKSLLVKASSYLKQRLAKKDLSSRSLIKTQTLKILEKYFYQQTSRRPMILPVIIEI